MAEGYPFDGSCDASRGADLTLRCAGDVFLKAHSCLLKHASPVLRTALDECRHDNEIDVSADPYRGWRLILNVLHSFGRFLVTGNEGYSPPYCDLILIGSLARKYDMQVVLGFVDDIVEREIRDNSCENDQDGCDCMKAKIFLGRDVLSVLGDASLLGMGKTARRCCDYIRECFVKANVLSASDCGWNEYGPQIVALMQRLRHNGAGDVANELAEKIISSLYLR